jgi:hypothetical protein
MNKQNIYIRKGAKPETIPGYTLLKNIVGTIQDIRNPFSIYGTTYRSAFVVSNSHFFVKDV